MRKITLLFVLIFSSLSIFATRYLVQNGGVGDAVWRAADAGETLVDLTSEGKTFNQWYNATVVASDEVWVAAGTYVLSGQVEVTKDNHSLHGGFAGTETSVSERTKVVDGYAWDFVNETILDGNNAVKILFSNNTRPNVIIDGFTMTNSNTANAAAQYRDGITVQNCKIVNNTSTGNGGGASFFNGGKLIDSYIAGNVAPIGAGVYSNTGSTTVTVAGCLIENNRANGSNGGAGLRVQGGSASAIAEVSNCIIRGNKSLNDAGNTYYAGGAISTNSVFNNFTNCLVYNNSGTTAVHFNGGNLNNVTIVNNAGQVYIAGASVAININNSIVWGNKTDASGETNTGITSNPNNKNVVINNSAIYPGLIAENYTQSDNIDLQLSNDSQDDNKGPGFVAPTTFWGAPTDSEENAELLSADWNIKYTSGCLDLGKTIAEVANDLAGISRPQGSAYDIGAYELPYYNTVVSFNAGGTVNDLSSEDVLSEPKGKSLVFTITPDAGMKVSSVKYNDVEVIGDMVDNVYTSPAITANSTLEVDFDFETGLSQANSKFIALANHNTIELKALEKGQMISVYDLTGSVVYNAVSLNSALSIPVTQGMYIIKVDDQLKKLLVK